MTKKNNPDYYEGDLSFLGYREQGILSQLLDLYSDRKLTEAAYDADQNTGELKFGFNASSGYVFLFNEDYDTFMLTEDETQIGLFNEDTQEVE